MTSDSQLNLHEEINSINKGNYLDKYKKEYEYNFFFALD